MAHSSTPPKPAHQKNPGKKPDPENPGKSGYKNLGIFVPILVYLDRNGQICEGKPK